MHRWFHKEGFQISLKSYNRTQGGGANTFAWNFDRYLTRKGIAKAKNLLLAKQVLIISDKVDYCMLWLAKQTGCFIVHRLDEHIQENEPDHRKIKHRRIMKINRLADFTIFQSNFVKDNVLPFLRTRRYEVIINGADPQLFYDRQTPRQYIGHVTNSVGDKKRLDLLESAIVRYPNELFLLVGNHAGSDIPFARYRNVTLVGPLSRELLSEQYQKMKCLYFPSENDPCPNTVVEAILSGVPVCYNPRGGTIEIVRDCGLPLEQFETLLTGLDFFRERCSQRADLYFDKVAEKYLKVFGLIIKEDRQ